MRKLLVLFLILPMFSACSNAKVEPAGEHITHEQELRNAGGKITGEDGFTLLGGKDKDANGGGAIGVNSYLWRATLDTLSFMPLASADPFGGTIITDWYEDPKTPGERFKVTAIILDKTLRSDGVRVQLFKQSLKGSAWRDQKVDPKLARQLEDTILTRARELKIASRSK